MFYPQDPGSVGGEQVNKPKPLPCLVFLSALCFPSPHLPPSSSRQEPGRIVKRVILLVRTVLPPAPSVSDLLNHNCVGWLSGFNCPLVQHRLGGSGLLKHCPLWPKEISLTAPLSVCLCASAAPVRDPVALSLPGFFQPGVQGQEPCLPCLPDMDTALFEMGLLGV